MVYFTNHPRGIELRVLLEQWELHISECLADYSQLRSARKPPYRGVVQIEAGLQELKECRDRFFAIGPFYTPADLESSPLEYDYETQTKKLKVPPYKGTKEVSERFARRRATLRRISSGISELKDRFGLFTYKVRNSNI